MKTRMILSISAIALFTGGSFAQADAIDTLQALDGMAHLNDFANGPVDPKDTTCNLAAARTTCANSSDSLAFKGCTVHSGKAVVNGGWDEVFAGKGADKCTYPLIDGESVTKTSKGLTLTNDKGSMELDSNGGTAYDGTVIPATGVTVSLAGNIKTITINGGHAIVKDQAGHVTKDHFMISPTALLMSGAEKDGSKLLASGVVKTFDQLAKSTSTTTFNKVAWSNPTCCHPTAGSISEVLTGSATGTTTLTFNSTCGSVTKVDKDGKSSDITLKACK